MTLSRIPSVFFNNGANASPGIKPSKEYSYINVGNEQFRAAAVTFIDAMQSSPRSKEVSMEQILKRFYQHFPKYISHQPYITTYERMGFLLDTPRKSELVECMAYVLRQLTVDELYRHPLEYREVFNGLSDDTPKSYLRDPKTQLPPCALNALAYALGITVTLSFKEPGKELRKREVYNGEEGKINAVVQVQEDGKEAQYIPRVKDKEPFTFVGQLAINAPQPVENTKEQGETIREINELIAEDNKRLLQSYNQWYKTILGWMIDGEYKCEQLIDLYINVYPINSITGSISVPSLETEKKQVIAGTPVAQEQKTIELLTSALASWFSTKQIDPDVLDQFESKKSLSV